MSILSINSTYSTNSANNTGAELRIKHRDRFVITETPVQFTPLDILCKRLHPDTDYDKAVIVLRHSTRPINNWDAYVELTDLGKYTAELAGEHIAQLRGSMQYFSTNTVRTKQTAYYMYKGRNKNIQKDSVIDRYEDVPLTYNNDIFGLDFVKNETKYNQYTHDYGYNNVWYDYIYGTGPIPEDPSQIVHKYADAFNDIDVESEKFIHSALAATEKMSVIISHDQNVMPLVAQATNYKINFKTYHGGSWLNFISGIAILEKNSEIYVVPITGTATGYN